MFKSLVYVNADLASSMALRYACNLAALTGMEINLLHVESPEAEDHSSGTGWVRRTWESSQIQEARERIDQLVSMEKDRCTNLNEPQIVLGNPETEILHAIAEQQYDLFIVGLLHSVSPQTFYKQLHSKFYQQAGCPILLVESLSDIKQVALLLEPEEEGSPQAWTFLKFFKGIDVDVDLVSCGFGKGDASASHGKGVVSTQMDPAHMDKTTTAVFEMLQAGGCTPRSIRSLEGNASAIGDQLASYHMVLTSLPHHIGPTSPLLGCLSRIPSALLFCRAQ